MTLKHLTKFLICVALLASCKESRKQMPPIEGGIADLRSWDFENDGTVALDGNWEFYRGKLYTPSELDTSHALESPEYLSVPGNWNNNKTGGFGYGTYHLKALVNGQTGLGFKFNGVATSYRMWINGMPAALNGIVSSDPELMRPQYLPVLKSMGSQKDTLDIVVQVANNFHSKGGMWESLYIGKIDNLTRERQVALFYVIFMIGVMFILFIYHICIYFLRRTEVTALWFALLCLSLLLRTLVTAERVLYHLLPDFNLNLGLRIEYLGLTVVIAIYTKFVYNLFPAEFAKKARYTIYSLAIIETLIVILTPAHIYSSLLLLYQAGIVATAAYIGLVVLPRAIKNKMPGSTAFLITFGFLMATIINDILSSRLVIHTIYLIPLGFFTSVLLQAYILASRISFAFGSMEQSSIKINDMNLELAHKLDELEQSEKKFRNIINTSPILICNIDTVGKLRFVSPSFRKTLGYRSEEMEGHSSYEYIHADDHNVVNDSFAKAALNPRKLILTEIRLLRKDGSMIDVEMRANALYEDRRIDGAIIMMNDITDRKIAQQTQEEYNRKLEIKVEERTQQLSQEKKKSDDLLLNILPSEVAEELKEKGRSEARLYEHVSVLFTDFVNFTGISEQLTPSELVAEIDQCFRGFDLIIDKYGLEKIKTIGDAYLAVCGLPNSDADHAINATLAAREIIEFMDVRKQAGGRFTTRIGIHSGPVIAGIVGSKKFAFDIWGDTVNTASRMESNSEPGRINISHATYAHVKDSIACVHRGKILAKNKGEIDMYFVA